MLTDESGIGARRTWGRQAWHTGHVVRRGSDKADIIPLLAPGDDDWTAWDDSPVAQSVDPERPRRRAWIAAVGLVAVIGVAAAVAGIDGPSESRAPDTTRPPASTTAPASATTAVAGDEPNQLDVSDGPAPLLVDLPEYGASGALTIRTNVSDSGELWRREIDHAFVRVSRGNGVGFGHASAYRTRLDDETIGVVERSGRYASITVNDSITVMGDADISRLMSVAAAAAVGPSAEAKVFEELGFDRVGAIEATPWLGDVVTYSTYSSKLGSSGSWPGIDLLAVQSSDLPDPIPDMWMTLLPERVEVRGAQAFSGWFDVGLGPKNTIVLPLAGGQFVLLSGDVATDVLVRAALSLRPAGADEWTASKAARGSATWRMPRKNWTSTPAS